MSTGQVSLIAFLTFIVGAAITLLILEIAGVNFDPERIQVPTACVDEGRYRHEEKGISSAPVSPDHAQNLVRNYYRHVYQNEDIEFTDGEIYPLSTGEFTKPGSAFISKRVIDAIFSNDRQANGIMCHFGWNDEDGEDGEEPGRMQLIVSPYVHNVTGFNASNEKYYLIRSYCPPDCFPQHAAE